jgi:hypothetical protein
MHVEDVGDQVRDDGRTRTPLRQRIVMACDLRNHCRDCLSKLEAFVSDKKSAHSSKIDGGEEILQINVEDVSPVTVLARVSNDGAFPFKAVSDLVLPLFRSINLIEAVLQQYRQVFLQQL